MPKANLISTDREILGLKKADKRYEVGVTEAHGLTIRVYPTGARVFEYRYVAANGKRRRMVLGTYPALSLKDARNKARKHQTSVVDGKAPSEELQTAKRAKRVGDTVGELAAGYFKAAAKGLHGGRKRPKSPRTISHEQRLYRLYIKRRFHESLITEVRRRDIKGFMRDLVLESGLSAASVGRVGETLSSIFAYAVHEDILEANPVHGLAHPLTWKSRRRMFSDPALKLLWDALVLHSVPRTPGESNPQDPLSRLDPLTCLAARLILLTLSRRNEICGARWDELNRASMKLTIPEERSKSGRTEVKPLSKEALSVIEATEAYTKSLFGNRNGEFIFPCLTDPTKPLDASQVARAIKRLCKRLEIPHGSPHDFRRSGATTLTDEKYAFPRFVVSKVLGHKIRDGAPVTDVYDLNEYLPQKRAALNAWAGHILSLEIAVAVESPETAEPRMAA